MNELKEMTVRWIPRAIPDGYRCCGRLLEEKCSPEEEATKRNRITGEKSCCKRHNHRN
jgi:hypothetical protein